jgi:hypothetical protein
MHTLAPSRRNARSVTVIATAAIVTALAWIVGRAAGVCYLLDTPLGTRPIGLAATVVATLLSGIVGLGVLALLRRYSRHVRGTWITLGILVLAVSVAPLFVATAPYGTLLTLGVLHCVAAAVLVPGLLWSTHR